MSRSQCLHRYGRVETGIMQQKASVDMASGGKFHRGEVKTNRSGRNWPHRRDVKNEEDSMSL